MDLVNTIHSTTSIQQKKSSKVVQKRSEFQEVLASKNQKNTSIKLSKHAEERLHSRNLQLESTDYHQIAQAMEDLADKGSKESLLIYKDMGLIANIHNRTIITAMDIKEVTTVTNIDSVKFIK